MVKYYYSVLFLLFSYNITIAQTTEDYAIRLTAIVQRSPPQITLTWPKNSGVDYQIYRKSKESSTWGSVIATVLPADTFYTDTHVIADSAYEYQVIASGTPDTIGYIYAGIVAPALHNRGAIILLIDSAFTDTCQAQLYQMMKDISGDGWQVIRHDLSRNLPDTTIKSIINKDFHTYTNVKAVLIFGHLAVPYSGDIAPDGHPQHMGAWPADIYYAVTSGNWTDTDIDDTTASDPQNWNVPGDGKWDQYAIPAVATLQVSRIDFYNMPDFDKSEAQLMLSYLAKDHLYKMDSLPMIHRGLVSDNFGTFGGEAFAANGWRVFSPLLGRENVYDIPFISSLNDSSYQWAYGCGPGAPTSAGGIGSTADISYNNMNVIFTMLFGSWFGDWNEQNNFLRAPLCANTPALTSCWAGRPNWFCHHMALGENIGYAAWLTQNNNIYTPEGYGAQFVHVALLGDLTLRTDYINPPGNLSINNPIHSGALLSWTVSPDTAVIGYYVYRSDSLFGSYQKISSMLTTTSYTDSSGKDGLKYYMVRAVKLQHTPSGNYYNLSIGITDSATISYPDLYVTNLQSLSGLSIYPNPAQNSLNIHVHSTNSAKIILIVNDQNGNKVLLTSHQLNLGDNSISLNVSKLQPGTYTVSLSKDNIIVTKKWIKLD